MTDSSSSSDHRIAGFAERFAFSEDAVRHLLNAVSAGGGDMALFDHPEFAGPGQWMRGGLIMITDPADDALKNRIEALCDALSGVLRQDRAAEVVDHRRLTPGARAWDVVDVAAERWWPSDFGEPSATGSQNDMAYAYFDQARRLAIRNASQVELYATGEHRITGTSQSQHDTDSGLVFTSQLGKVSLDDLERVHEIAAGSEHPTASETDPHASDAGSHDILEAIERLGDLYSKGILSEDEFKAKKQELLGRL